MARLGVGGELVAVFTAMLVLALIVYWPILSDYFVFDDYAWLNAASNPDASNFFRKAFSFPAQTPFEQRTPFWRPLVDTYFYAGWRVFGLEPAGWHVMNVLLHSANATLATVLTWKLTRSRATAIIAGALFVVLPTYEIAVSWISSATELYATLFYLLTLVLYHQSMRAKVWQSWFYWTSLATMLLALLSKESAVTLPAMVALLDWSERRDSSADSVTETIRDTAPFLALAAAYIAFIYVEQYVQQSTSGRYEFGAHGFENLWEYLKWIALPISNGALPAAPALRPFFGSLLLLFGLFVFAVRNRGMMFAFVWMIIALTPYVFFPGTSQRYTYLAAVPLSILVAIAFTTIGAIVASRLGKIPTAVAMMTLAVVAGSFLIAETQDRQERLSLHAQFYELLFRDGPEICGDLSARDYVYVVDPPGNDPTGNRTRMVLNLAYEENIFVKKVRAQELAGVEAQNAASCVIAWDGGERRYVKGD